MKKSSRERGDGPEAEEPREGVSRREFFKRSGAVIGTTGLGGALLTGCGPAEAVQPGPKPVQATGPSWTTIVGGPFVYDESTMIEEQAGTLAYVRRLEFGSPRDGTSDLLLEFTYSGTQTSTRLIQVDMELRGVGGDVLTTLSRVTTDGRIAADEANADPRISHDVARQASATNHETFPVDEAVANATQEVQITLTEL